MQLETVAIRHTDEAGVPEKTREEVRPGSPYVAFSVAPFVTVKLDNPQQRSGLFSVHLNVMEAESSDTFTQKLAKQIGLKDLSGLQIWRYADAVLGPRKLPLPDDHATGKVLLEKGVFSIDTDARVVFLKPLDGAEKIAVGSNLVYVVV